MELPAVGLEDRLVACLANEVVDLRLGLVVHLLDAGWVDTAVLEQSLERELRHLAADAVERREDDCLRRVVDDEVDARQVLERADVATLSADDSALHVVGGKLDDRDGRLGRVARGNPLESVCDEVAGTPPRLRGRLLVELADTPSELVAHELLRTLQHLGLRILHAQPGDPLQLALLESLGSLQLLLELLDVRLTIGEPLTAALELLAPAA